MSVKKNSLLIASFLILLIILLFSFFKFRDEKRDYEETLEENIQFCLDNDYIGTEYESFCLENLSDNNKIDFFTAFANVVSRGFRTIATTLFLFIAIPCLWNTCKYLRNKVIKNDLTRMNYKKIRYNLFKEAYKSVLILPLIVIIGIILCYILTGSFSADYSIQYRTAIWSAKTLGKPFLFLVAYVLNMIFTSIIYVNICLAVARKYHNYFVALILSFLCFIGIEAFLEIVIGGILFTSIFKSDASIIFNIMNMMTFNDSFGILPVISFSCAMAIISTIVVFLLYKNKEKLVIDCEAN